MRSIASGWVALTVMPVMGVVGPELVALADALDGDSGGLFLASGEEEFLDALRGDRGQARAPTRMIVAVPQGP